MTTEPRLSDLIVKPNDDGWDLARQAFNLTVDQHPAMVARPSSVEEVIAVVEYARDNGLRIAPQRTGHNAGPIESLADTVLLRTDNLTGIEIHPDAKLARVEAGAKWGPVSDAANEHGLLGLAGSARDVGVVGYHLGGGLSFLSRKHGLAANSVLAIELVTADGRVVRTDKSNDPELFWALRGGGGNFGVVTAIEFQLYEEKEIYAGNFFFPLERASEVLHLWREWTLGMPEELTSVAKMLRVPPVEEIPEPIRGRAFVTVCAVFLGREAAGAELVKPLRDLGPEMDTFAMVEPAALGYIAMDPEDPVPYLSEHLLTGELPAEAIDELVAVAGPDSGATLTMVELRHTGGALARSDSGHGAIDTLSGSFVMFSVGALMDPSLAPVVAGQLDCVREAVEPWKAGYYANFTERPCGASAVYGEAAYPRLQAVKAEWDPNRLFVANHDVRA